MSPRDHQHAQARIDRARLAWEQTPEPPRREMPKTPWRRWHFAHFHGSPIPVRLAPCEPFSHRRLYLGPSFFDRFDVPRPEVETIVNLCECEDFWPPTASDIYWLRGEGVFGYTWDQLYADAAVVAARLRAGKTILIHCMAGVNRSPTLTCATLMRLEGISAAEALARVYRFHPPAHPENHHWLVLRQLEQALKGAERA